ncbi:MAG: aminoglycoside 6-N-acetyltransferase [Actinomycetota bacterium]|nr:aminoglycoside 6-N-acetyltransferase [Actinomycetota bacterium]
MDDDEGERSFEGIQQHYGPRTDPQDVTIAAFIELNETPIGYIQFYPWAAYAEEARDMSIPLDGESWGLDVFIGEPDALNQGHGSRAVDLLCRYLFDECGATSVALLTEITNSRAQRAYEKAGFRKVRHALDLDVRAGERIQSWLMVRERDGQEPEG